MYSSYSTDEYIRNLYFLEFLLNFFFLPDGFFQGLLLPLLVPPKTIGLLPQLGFPVRRMEEANTYFLCETMGITQNSYRCNSDQHLLFIYHIFF